jgi:hypothetical protein
MRNLLFGLAALAAVQVHATEQERWELSSPRVQIRLHGPVVRDLGLRLSPAPRADRAGYRVFDVAAQGRLVALAGGSVFRTVESGELRLSGGPTFLWKGDSVTLRDAILRPGTEPDTFVIAGADGSSLFYADHQHVTLDRGTGALRLFNLDLRVTPELAARVGDARFAGVAVGALELNLTAAIPRDSRADLMGACTNPNWGSPVQNDVALTGITPIQQMDRGNGLVVIAPSAILTNAGSTDVPWIAKFSPPGPPYNVDQHPFLIWNMYRVLNGQIKQIGASGVKHAFLTVNEGCACPAGDILWVGCSDTYGTFTNNDAFSLSPRHEVTAHTGVWKRCGSIFDPNCDNVENFPPEFTGVADDRRMVVAESDLGNPGGQYFFDAWYVVRDDVNIFNTMGWVPVTLSFSGSTWTVSPGAKSDGAVLDGWVNPSSPGPNADNKRIVTAEGRLTLAVRATSLGGGQWRYDYALMNHDFDRRIRSFSVPVPGGGTVTAQAFTSVNRNPGSAWVATAPAGQARWEIPGRPARDGQGALDWGNLNTFSFVTNRPPSAVGAVTVTLGVQEAPGGSVTVGILGPS